MTHDPQLLVDYWDAEGLRRLGLVPTNLQDIERHIDPQQVEMIKSWTRNQPTPLAFTKLDKAEFNRLIFIRNAETLAVVGSDRSLLGVTSTIAKQFSLHDLFQKDMFRDVKLIYENFDYQKLGYLLLKVPTRSTERAESAGGSCYIEGGNHRALALAIKVNLEGFKFQPIDAIVVYHDDR